MSMLRINGYPVTVARLKEKVSEVGERSASVAGTPLLDRIGFVREWDGRTPLLSASVIDVMRKLIKGAGQVWPFDADVYSSKGLGPSTGSPQYDIWGAAADSGAVVDAYQYTGAIAISPAATNLVDSANERTGTDDQADTSGFTAVAGATLVSSTTYAWQGSRSLGVIAGATGRGADTAAVSCSSATIYTGTVYIRGASGKEIRVQLIDDVGTVATVDHTLTSTNWERVRVTGTTDGAATTILLRVLSNDGSTTFYLDGLQIEESMYSTAWVNGARAADDEVQYDGSTDAFQGLFANDFTISLWVRADSIVAYGSVNFPILSITNSAGAAVTDGIYIVLEDDDLSVSIFGGDATPDIFVSGVSGVADGTFRHVVVVYKASPGAGESNLEVYVDGSSEGTDSGSETLDNTALVTMELGAVRNNLLVGSVALDDLVIVPYAMTAAQVSAIYGAGTAHALLPKVHVDGDFIDDGSWTVEALGMIGKAAYGVGGGSNNLRELSFKLIETDLGT